MGPPNMDRRRSRSDLIPEISVVALESGATIRLAGHWFRVGRVGSGLVPGLTANRNMITSRADRGNPRSTPYKFEPRSQGKSWGAYSKVYVCMGFQEEGKVDLWPRQGCLGTIASGKVPRARGAWGRARAFLRTYGKV